MTNIVSLADKVQDSKFLSPLQSLEEAIEEIKNGKRKCTKVLVLTLDDEDGKYMTGFYCANMKGSERMALLARALYRVNQEIDGV